MSDIALLLNALGKTYDKDFGEPDAFLFIFSQKEAQKLLEKMDKVQALIAEDPAISHLTLKSGFHAPFYAVSRSDLLQDLKDYNLLILDEQDKLFVQGEEGFSPMEEAYIRMRVYPDRVLFYGCADGLINEYESEHVSRSMLQEVAETGTIQIDPE